MFGLQLLLKERNISIEGLNFLRHFDSVKDFRLFLIVPNSALRTQSRPFICDTFSISHNYPPEAVRPVRYKNTLSPGTMGPCENIQISLSHWQPTDGTDPLPIH